MLLISNVFFTNINNLIMGNTCCGQSKNNGLTRNKVCTNSLATAKKMSISTTQEASASNSNEFDYLKLSEQKFQSVRKVSELGKGGQGIVYLVSIPNTEQKDKQTNQKKYHFYAMKKVKARKNQRSAVQNQILLSSSLKSLFICPLRFFYKDRASNYYLFFDLKEGGDLFDYKELLNQEKIKFVMACIILALEVMHQACFVHRDIKLENILLDKSGYPLITDLGMSQSQPLLASSAKLRGTMSYLAPQLLENRKQVDRGLDLWALGIALQYMSFNCYPYSKDEIMSGNFIQKCRENQMKYNKNENTRSKELKDLINCLLRANKEERLGYNGFDQLKGHNFFSEIDWEKLNNKQLDSPFKELVAVNSSILKKTTI